jgi:hypothetical protein
MNFSPKEGLTPLIFLSLCASIVLYSRDRLLIPFDSISETSHNSGPRPVSSAELLCTIAPPPFAPSGTSPVLPSSPSAYSSSVSMRLALQKRANLRARQQQRYSRDESALIVAARRLAEYERLFPPRPSMQYATKQLELRVSDAKARLMEIRDHLRDDTTDRVTHQALLRTRWMLERWISSAEKESLRASTSGRPIPPESVVYSTRMARRDANLAHFFAHSPTRTATSSSQRKYSSRIEQPRTISKHNIEPPQLRKWPLTTTLLAPMKLRGFSSTSHDTISERSTITLAPASLPSFSEQPHSHEVDSVPLTRPSIPVQATSPISSFPPIPDIPIDDSLTRAWPGFAVIYVPPQPSDEELLAALNADMEAEPMPEYVSYLLDQLEPIGEGLFLPGLSRRGTTTSSGFEFISRPSIEVYEYPVLPRSRLLVRRSVRIPPVRTRLGILSGLRAVCEDPSHTESLDSLPAQERASPRSGVFSKMRRSMTALGHQ